MEFYSFCRDIFQLTYFTTVLCTNVHVNAHMNKIGYLFDVNICIKYADNCVKPLLFFFVYTVDVFMWLFHVSYIFPCIHL